MVKRLPTMREIWAQSLGREDLLEKEMATHSSILAWKISWMEEPGKLQSMGLQRVGHNWETSLSHFLILFFFNRLYFSEQISLHNKTEQKIEFSSMLCPYTRSFPTVNTLQFYGTFITVDEPMMAYCYHSQCTSRYLLMWLHHILNTSWGTVFTWGNTALHCTWWQVQNKDP